MASKDDNQIHSKYKQNIDFIHEDKLFSYQTRTPYCFDFELYYFLIYFVEDTQLFNIMSGKTIIIVQGGAGTLSTIKHDGVKLEM